jgi:thiol-disulfide isomerase/thioredoxin
MNKLKIFILTAAYTACFAYYGPAGIKLPSLQDLIAAPSDQAAPDSRPAKGAAYEKKDTYFKLPAAAGGVIDLASYAGKPVFVFFFTETCPYCRKAGPALERIYKAYGPKGLNLIGISLEDTPEGALNYARSLGVTFPLAYAGQEISAHYRVQGVPYIYALDSGHSIYDVWEGYDESYDPQIEKTIKSLLSIK